MKLRLPLLPAWLRWTGVLAVAAFIFSVSVVVAPAETPVDPAKPGLFDLDKWRHFVAYAAFGGSLSYALVDRDAPVHRLVAVVGVTAVSFGVGIELCQLPLPQRYFSPGDAYANALGATLSLSWYLVHPLVVPVPVGELVPDRWLRWVDWNGR